jgi:hypothetical protein
MSGILLTSVGNSYGSLPVNVVAPAITGTATVGSTLTTSDGTWTGAPAPTFSYQWQRVTTDISGATSSTYVVQSADGGSTIRCVVTATNPLGAVSANTANTAAVPLTIGQAFGGGFFAGQISTAANGIADFNLVVAPRASGQIYAQMKTNLTFTAGTSSFIDGPGNTAAMIALGAATFPCANFCNNLVIGGFSDWYQPARKEYQVIYYFLKPSTAANSVGNPSPGASNTGNIYSVPPLGNNTSGNPAQTSVAAFQRFAGAQEFLPSGYWASDQPSYAGQTYGGSYFSFGEGATFGVFYKTNSQYVRAVRRVAV